MNEPRPYTITYLGATNMSIPRGGVIYTDSLKFGGVNNFALSYIQTATGIPNIKIQMEQSITPPTIENVADTNFGVPKSVGDIETTLTSKTIQHMELIPVSIAYVRFKITEQTNLVTDTVVNMWMSLQKKSFGDS
jgi:hypothetical protein